MRSGAIRSAFIAILAAASIPEAAQAFATSPALPAVFQGRRFEIPTGRNLPISGDARIAPGEYVRPAIGPDGELGVIVLKGVRGARIDMSDVQLFGSPLGTTRDRMQGFGILLIGCDDVTLVGGEVGGYRACIVAENCHNLTIEGFTFRDYRSQRLRSSVAAENEGDWLRPHENDNGEWLDEYGAAISLTDCTQVTVRGCTARGGQNGLIMNRCGETEVYDNDFSFLSGWGLAMYRSSRNVVANNKFDYCVRGFSQDVYWRGQDSAGILMFERCSKNVIASNSATHCGDGLFLYGGQDVVEGRAFDRGEKDPGGSDDNLIYQNDFSFAVANGIETTFSSDNRVIENVARGCHQHGLWGGYSRGLVVVGNQFQGTRGNAVSIEHGQECLIAKNVMHDNRAAIELWWDEDPQFVDGPFGEHFDTASRDHWIVGNSMANNDGDFSIRNTTGLVVSDNVFESNRREPYQSEVTILGEEPPTDAIELTRYRERLASLLSGVGGWMPSGNIADTTIRAPEGEKHPAMDAAQFLVPPRVPGGSASGTPRSREGFGSIVMGEWGPWDFESDDPRPRPRLAGGVLVDAKWDATWFSWLGGPDPRGAGETLEEWRALAKNPLTSGTVRAWQTPWGEGERHKAVVGRSKFGLIADAVVELPAGTYQLSIVSDDGVRLMVDGEVVLENWTWHAATRDTVEVQLNGGRHELVLEYFQIDGSASLSIDLDPLAPQ